jgi:hypothetical protein
MARRRTQQTDQMLSEERKRLANCDNTKWCRCIRCFESRNTTNHKDKPYNIMTYMDDLIENSDYDPLAYLG